MFGMSVWHFKFSRALIAALFPSSMGILVYMFVTSIEQSKMSLAKVMSSMVFMKWVESLMYDGRSLTACLSQWSQSPEEGISYSETGRAYFGREEICKWTRTL